MVLSVVLHKLIVHQLPVVVGKGEVQCGVVRLDQDKVVPLESHVILFKDSSLTTLSKLIPKESLKIKVIDEVGQYSKDDIERTIKDGNAAPLTVSMDLADMITCSTGEARSCLSVDNIHAAGAIQNFRTEFAAISFTARARDRFYKKGRSWLFLRVTERGHIREYPFWKQQKSYGTVTETHQQVLNGIITERAKKITSTKFTKKPSFHNYITSPNVSTRMIDVGHTAAPGYIDTISRDYTSFYVPGDQTGERFSDSREVLLPFEDMLDLNGEVSNITSFHHGTNNSNYFGALTPNIYEVTCNKTNTIVLDTDAVEIDGKWIRKDILGQLLNGDVEVTLDKPKAVETQDEGYEDVDLDDDF